MKLIDIVPLFESEESKKYGYIVRLTIKANQSLSSEARHAIAQWQQSGWDNGPLQKSYNDKDAIYQDITRAFAPVKEKLKELFGDTLKLHRGQKNYPDEELSPDSRQLFSFSFDERVATEFAHPKIHKQYSDEDVERALEQYRRTGFVQFDGKKYQRINDEQYNVYDKYNRRTDIGDDIEWTLGNIAHSTTERNARAKTKGQVHTMDVPVDSVFWITNSLNQKEAIVAMNPLKKAR